MESHDICSNSTYSVDKCHERSLSTGPERVVPLLAGDYDMPEVQKLSG